MVFQQSVCINKNEKSGHFFVEKIQKKKYGEIYPGYSVDFLSGQIVPMLRQVEKQDLVTALRYEEVFFKDIFLC